MKIYLPLLFMLSFLSWSCKGTQYASPSEYPKKQVVFGSGGGFTGKIDRYTLLANGQLFHHNSLTREESQVKTLSKKEVKEVFRRMKEIGFADMEVQKQGNYSYFVELKDGEHSHACKWVDDMEEVPFSLRDLYKTLMKKTEITE